MSKGFKATVYLLNLAFLFYTLIGPAIVFHYYLSSDSGSDLFEIEYIVKDKDSKKIVQEKERFAQTVKQSSIFETEDWLLLHKGIEFFYVKIEKKLYFYNAEISSIKYSLPFYLLFQNLRL